VKHGLSADTVNRVREVMARFPELEKAILYGSRANGNYKAGSDIDLTLVGTALTSGVLSGLSDQLDDLLLPYKIDLSIFAKISHPDLIEHIRRVGIVFYEKHPATPPR
jgi:predicted nucleotidyltransferase